MKSINSIFFILFLFLTGCASYQYSSKSKGEKIIVTVRENPNDVINRSMLKKTQVNPEKLNDTRATFVGEAFSLATEGVKMLIEMDKKKYKADYKKSINQLYFYNRPSVTSAMDPRGMQFEGINIVRLVQNNTNGMDTALFISMSVDLENPYEIINNSVFRLKVDSLFMKYSKAKIPGFRWYLPWTIMYKTNNKINLDLEIKISASYVNSNGNIVQNETIGIFLLGLRDLPLNSMDASYQEYYNKRKGTVLSGYSFLVPRSYGYYFNDNREYIQCWGQGAYNLSVKVNEAGKDQFITKIMLDNSDTMIETASKSVKKLISK